MAYTNIVGSPQDMVIHPQEMYSVWVKPTYGADWEFVPYLFPINSTWATFPSESTASFELDYGEYLNLFDVGNLLVPLNLQNWYISIWVHTVYGTYMSWAGIITGESLKMEGVDPYNIVPRGIQTITANGFEFLLSRRCILGSWVDGEPNKYFMEDGFIFNGVEGVSGMVGNRSEYLDPEFGTYIFGRPGYHMWSDYDILMYLLKAYSPYDIDFILTGQTVMLQHTYRQHDFRGLTLRDALNDILDNRRGICAQIFIPQFDLNDMPQWYIDYYYKPFIEINIVSISQRPIYGPNILIPPNPLQTELFVENDPYIDVTLNINNVNQYDEIIVESEEPLKTMLTLGFDNASLEVGWKLEEELIYYAANDEYRSSDELKKVYSYYRVPKTFSWYNAIPRVDNLGNVNWNYIGSYYPYDMRFENYLPIFKEGGLDDTSPEYKPPFAICYVPPGLKQQEEGGEGEEKGFEEEPPIEGDPIEFKQQGGWNFVENLSMFDLPNVSYQQSTTELAFTLNTSLSHMFASGFWNINATESIVSPSISLSTIYATVFVRSREKLRVILPILRPYEGGSKSRQLNVVVPGFELWVVAPGTIIDVIGGDDGVILYNGPPVIRNDAPYLYVIGNLLWIWFAQQRAIADIEIRNLLPWFRLGALITNSISGFSYEQIGTVITQIEYDYVNLTQHVTTGWGEMDPMEISASTGYVS